MRVYLDASTIIYSIEGAPPLRETVLARLEALASAAGATTLTSRLSRLECRVKPLRDDDQQLLATYDVLFARASLQVMEIGPAVVERATILRVRYGFKTPDAIHIATALQERADLFLTGDKQLSRCGELAVEVI